MKISCVLVTLNDEKNVNKCLANLKVRSKFSEVIVVDGGSSDSTVIKCKKFTRKVYKTKKGIGYQTYFGINKAKGEFVILIEADNFYPKNFIENFYKSHLKSNSDITSAIIYNKSTKKNFFSIGQHYFMKIHYNNLKKKTFPTLPMIAEKKILQSIYKTIYKFNSYGVDTARAEIVKKKKLKCSLTENYIYENNLINFDSFKNRMRNYGHGDYEYYKFFKEKFSLKEKLRSASHIFIRYGIIYPIKSIFTTNPLITIPYLWMILFYRYYFWLKNIIRNKSKN